MEELTVFINVKIPNLNESSMWKPFIVKRQVIKNKDNTNIKTDKKYLCTSASSNGASEKLSLLIKIFFGFEWDKRLFIEYLNKE